MPAPVNKSEKKEKPIDEPTKPNPLLLSPCAWRATTDAAVLAVLVASWIQHRGSGRRGSAAVELSRPASAAMALDRHGSTARALDRHGSAAGELSRLGSVAVELGRPGSAAGEHRRHGSPLGSSDVDTATGSGRKEEVAPLPSGGSAASRQFLHDARLALAGDSAATPRATGGREERGRGPHIVERVRGTGASRRQREREGGRGRRPRASERRECRGRAGR